MFLGCRRTESLERVMHFPGPRRLEFRPRSGTPVYVGLLPGQIVTLSVDWTNPPSGGYIATAQAFYGAAGTLLNTPGATIKSIQFKVDPLKGTTGAVAVACVPALHLVWGRPRRHLRHARPV